MISASRKALLLESIEGCSSWDDIHAKWAGFSKEDKGARFEDLTQAFLQVHETYAKEFVNIWRPDEVPAAIAKKLKLRVPEWGIDLVGETRSGEFWSIQCKYLQDTDQELSHRIIASSVATTFESSRGFSYLLVCTTTQRVTNHYDHNPKVLFYGMPIWQQIDAAFLDTLRSKLAGKKVALTPYSPRKHQVNAIQDGLKHFKVGNATRGKLIMPCGTGKSLTAWFLSQALGSKRVVIAVPSLSLVKQTLGVWTREAFHNNVAVDWICVCSDETAGRVEQDDAAIKVKDLGVPCHTSPDEIAKWLKKEHKGITVVFTTYQSGQVLATAARKAKYAFDLGIMDEAHKTVGDGDKLFSHLIHDHNIEIRQRVFMTATERRFSGSSDKILSMDDPEVYGETFHLLTFKKAMEVVEGERPILCDYNVITIGVSRQEVKELIQNNLFVRPDSGKWDEDMEADMLAAMVALRKAMQEYPIKHAVSFHGSIKRAEQFREYNDSFTEEFPSFGQLSTFHVSGRTPTGTRSNVIKQFAKADRSLVTNARCLTEGVDVPSIDCVLFADPKKSKVDIVQAVGRALRPAQGKKLGYVILPVLHDEDSGELKESGAFKEVINMLATLASQDERIIDEFRAISQGRLPAGSGHVRFELGEPIAANVDLPQFNKELQIKCWGRLAKLSWRPFEEAREFVRGLRLKGQKDWAAYYKGNLRSLEKRPLDIPTSPQVVYKNKGWIDIADWIGHISDTRRFSKSNPAQDFTNARAFARSLNLRGQQDWVDYCAGRLPGVPPLPKNIPTNPQKMYDKNGWISMGDWLGTGFVSSIQKSKSWKKFAEAKLFAQSLSIKSCADWDKYCKSGKRPEDIPRNPKQVYPEWEGWGDWLGTGVVAARDRKYMTYKEARDFISKIGLKSSAQWVAYCKNKLQGIPAKPDSIPAHPQQHYKYKGWLGMGDWLGTGTLGPGSQKYMLFDEAKSFVINLNLKNNSQWIEYCGKNGLPGKPPKPKNIPASPDRIYKDSGWISWGDWLGTGALAYGKFPKMPFHEARAFVRTLQLSNRSEWASYCAGNLPDKTPLPIGIPKAPYIAYKDQWVSLADWLGNDGRRVVKSRFFSFEAARRFARSLNLKSYSEWIKLKSTLPNEIPKAPDQIYKLRGWLSWGDWLGTGKVANRDKAWLDFQEARSFVRKLGLKNSQEWIELCKTSGATKPQLPSNIPSNPHRTYKDNGWNGMKDWLGTSSGSTSGE